MIDTTTATKKDERSFKEKSWDALCGIQQDISGASQDEVQMKFKQVI